MSVNELQSQRSTAGSIAELDGCKLHAAVAAIDVQLATEVLQLARDKQFSRESLLVQQDSSGRTPLHVYAELPMHSASSNVLELWELLLDGCTNPASKLALEKQDCSGRTVLHVLIQHQQLSMLRRLLQTCNTLDCFTALLTVEDVQGISAVLLAQRVGNEQILALLSEYCSEVRECKRTFIQSYAATAPQTSSVCGKACLLQAFAEVARLY
jgi:hypothetical protein